MSAYQTLVGAAHEAATRRGVHALIMCNMHRADRSYARQTNNVNPIRLDSGACKRKGAREMAKLHARPSNQYRYEHYDPRF
jgi:hypothetical protein